MTKERMNPPLPRVRPQVQAKDGNPVGSAGPGAKSVQAMGSKRDQPMALALGAWQEAAASIWGIQATDQGQKSVSLSSDSLK